MDVFTHTIPVRPWNARTVLLLPAVLLLLLVVAPPHALDMAVSSFFYDAAADSWPWHSVPFMSVIMHKSMKAVPIVIALALLGLLLWDARMRRKDCALLTDPARARTLYAVVGMLASVILVWWLKDTTGVSCPWNVAAFGGSDPIRAPSFSLFGQPGNCWPAGHAGTGFCLLALWFALRDGTCSAARNSRWALLFALVVGVSTGVARMMQGAHFLSHTIATALVDWLVVAVIYVLLFDRSRVLGRLKSAFTMPVAWWAGIMFTAAWWTFVFSAPFLKTLLLGADAAGGAAGGGLGSVALNPEHVRFSVTIGAALGLFGLTTGLLALLSSLPKVVFKTLLVVFAALGATAFVASTLYATVFTPDMMRNFIATDVREASAYFSLRSALIWLTAFVPVAFVGLLVEAHPTANAEKKNKVFILRAVKTAGLTLAGLALGLAAFMTVFQAFSGIMRAEKSMRYLIAPYNIAWSTVRTLTVDASPDAGRERIIVDRNVTATVTPTKPTVFFVMVGETTRAANWQLSGYHRETTPNLARLVNDPGFVSFPAVSACGTSTDVSLPCMFSRIGRSDYDRDRILSEEALPALLQRAGMNVLWIDNQSGCKGACAGVPTRETTPDADHCPDGRCLDTVFVKEAENLLAKAQAADGTANAAKPTVVFMHLYGQHGPSYFVSSKPEDKVFLPECTKPDLTSCPRGTIVNAFDNSVLTTDKAVSGVIELVKAAEDAGKVNGAVLFIPDHGESLGENGLFLHGAPYLMAPKEQTVVPMALWVGKGFARDFRVDLKKIRAKAVLNAGMGEGVGRVTHEKLYSTIMRMLGVTGSTYRAEWDLQK